MGCPETLAQWMSPAVKRPASKKQGISSTPSNPAPVTRRRAASMAAISATTWPRSVESLRLTTSIGRAETLAEGEQAGGYSGVQFDGGVFRQAAGVGQDEAGGPRFGQTGGVLVGFENGDDGDVVHGLRAGGVVVEHGDTAAGGGVSGPDPLARPRFVPHGRGGGEDFLGGRAAGVGARWRSSELLGLGNEGHEICRPPLTS